MGCDGDRVGVVIDTPAPRASFFLFSDISSKHGGAFSLHSLVLGGRRIDKVLDEGEGLRGETYNEGVRVRGSARRRRPPLLAHFFSHRPCGRASPFLFTSPAHMVSTTSPACDSARIMHACMSAERAPKRFFALSLI